jgi:hypothetical protein
VACEKGETYLLLFINTTGMSNLKMETNDGGSKMLLFVSKYLTVHKASYSSTLDSYLPFIFSSVMLASIPFPSAFLHGSYT